MKRILTIALGIMLLQACNTGSKGEEGTQNDGMSPLDTNGALNDHGGPLSDSTNDSVENRTRTDIQQRDTFKTPGQ
ncbi:MAG TPA: hypothetical protein VM888_09240 [Chitinophagaceae bacterium]|jgi:hypothetical protein|nr:hypothetical protein [Chitinophagaceae bacterium]